MNSTRNSKFLFCALKAARSTKFSTAVVAILLFLTNTTFAQWTSIDLHPAGAQSSRANAIRNGITVGAADSTGALWTGSAASYVNMGGSRILGTDGVQQVGTGFQGTAIWTGTPGSVNYVLSSSPPGYAAFGTEARGVYAGMQVGGTGYIALVGGNNHIEAGYWLDTTASYTSLHPANATHSIAEATHNQAQVGSVNLTSTPGNWLPEHAALWYSNPNFVDLHPAGAVSSIAYDIYSGVQVGSANYGSTPIAAMWTGSAASFTSLHPAVPNVIASELFGTYNGVQAGYVTLSTVKGNFEHASFWSNTSQSWVDLHQYLPSGFANSRAESVWTANNGDQYVAGWAVNANGFAEAKLWTTATIVPEVSSIGVAMIGVAAVIGLYRKRGRGNITL